LSTQEHAGTVDPATPRPEPMRVRRFGDPPMVSIDPPAASSPVPSSPVSSTRRDRLRERLSRRPEVTERAVVLAGDALVAVPLMLLVPDASVLVGLAAAMLGWGARGGYRRRIGLSVLDELPTYIMGVGLGLLAVLVFEVVWWGAVGRGVDVALAGPMATAVLAEVVAVLLVGVVAARTASYRVVRALRRRGVTARTTVVVGSGEVASSIADRIVEHPESGLRLAGAVFAEGRRPVEGVARLGGPDELARIVVQEGVSDILVGYGSSPDDELVDTLRACDRLDVEIMVIPRLFEMHDLRADEDVLWDIPLRRIRRPTHRGVSWRIKRMFDVISSALALLALSPLMVVIALAVRVELGRGVIFRQQRIGLDGEPFWMLKFRSMRPPPEGRESEWSVSDPKRVGPIGRFLRRYSLDELPQLWNVLRGDMSVVGPRPERPEYVEWFSQSVRRYGSRHRVPAGLTGLAAVRGLRGDTSIADRAQADNWYIENWSLWFDTKIIARTVLAVVRGTGG
jgi:exopolysaccharide biosynthesis polyprenyl glycosylphosphotransferase